MSARNVIVAVDQSEESNYALTWALENYVKEEDHVELVFAQPDPEESIVVASGGKKALFSSQEMIIIIFFIIIIFLLFINFCLNNCK